PLFTFGVGRQACLRFFPTPGHATTNPGPIDSLRVLKSGGKPPHSKKQKPLRGKHRKAVMNDRTPKLCRGPLQGESGLAANNQERLAGKWQERIGQVGERPK